MKHLHVNRLGVAFGLTGMLFYIGCIILMSILGGEATAVFFNSLLHGLDTSGLIRMDISFWEVAMGIVLTFILSWISGALIAAIYNFGLSEKSA